MADKKDSDGKVAATSITISLLAGFVARVLAKMTPERAKEYLQHPEDLLGIKIPTEFASTVLGGFIGWTVVKIVERIFPNISTSDKDFITDFAVMVGEEYDDVIKAGTPAGKPAAASTVQSRNLVVCWAFQGVIFLRGCPAHHDMVVTFEEVDAGKGRKRKEARSTPRTDCRYITPEVASALWEKGARTPASEDEGCTLDCVCETEVPKAIEEYRKKHAEETKPKTKREPLITPEDWRKAGRWVKGEVSAVVTAVGNAGKAVVQGAKTAGIAVGKEAKAVDARLQTADGTATTFLKDRIAEIKRQHAGRRP